MQIGGGADVGVGVGVAVVAVAVAIAGAGGVMGAGCFGRQRRVSIRAVSVVGGCVVRLVLLFGVVVCVRVCNVDRFDSVWCVVRERDLPYLDDTT